MRYSSSLNLLLVSPASLKAIVVMEVPICHHRLRYKPIDVGADQTRSSSPNSEREVSTRT
jgi:hypothetical protein